MKGAFSLNNPLIGTVRPPEIASGGFRSSFYFAITAFKGLDRSFCPVLTVEGIEGDFPQMLSSLRVNRQDRPRLGTEKGMQTFNT